MGIHHEVAYGPTFTVNNEEQQKAEEQSKRGKRQSGEATRNEMGGAVETLDTEDAKKAGAIGDSGGGSRRRQGGRLLRSKRERRRRRAPGASPVPRLLRRLSRVLHCECDLLRNLSL